MQWSDLARHIPGRIAKQCRERYLNHLDPSLRKDMPWTEDEEALLMRLCFAKQNQVRWVFACLGVVLHVDSGEGHNAGGSICGRYPTMPTGSRRSKALTAQQWAMVWKQGMAVRQREKSKNPPRARHRAANEKAPEVVMRCQGVLDFRELDARTCLPVHDCSSFQRVAAINPLRPPSCAFTPLLPTAVGRDM